MDLLKIVFLLTLLFLNVTGFSLRDRVIFAVEKNAYTHRQIEVLYHLSRLVDNLEPVTIDDNNWKSLVEKAKTVLLVVQKLKSEGAVLISKQERENLVNRAKARGDLSSFKEEEFAVAASMVLNFAKYQQQAQLDGAGRDLDEDKIVDLEKRFFFRYLDEGLIYKELQN